MIGLADPTVRWTGSMLIMYMVRDPKRAPKRDALLSLPGECCLAALAVGGVEREV